MIKEIRKTIKELENNKISILDLNIVYEMDEQLLCNDNINITDEEYRLLFDEIKYAYLKIDEISLFRLIDYALKNKSTIIDDKNNLYDLVYYII